MDVRAAVAVEAGKPLEIMTVQLEGPKAGEVLVEIKATTVDKRRLSDFTLRVQFTRQQSSEEAKIMTPGAKPAAGAAKSMLKDGKP